VVAAGAVIKQDGTVDTSKVDQEALDEATLQLETKYEKVEKTVTEEAPAEVEEEGVSAGLIITIIVIVLVLLLIIVLVVLVVVCI